MARVRRDARDRSTSCSTTRPHARTEIGSRSWSATSPKLANWNDSERVARAEIEIDAITDQLSSAYGLSGRTRTTGDPAERVRKAVTNRIKDSLSRIAVEHEPLGRHLANSVRTGSFCSYAPEHPTVWELG